MTSGNCRKCGKTISWELSEDLAKLGKNIAPTLCNACADRLLQEAKEAEVQKRADEWRLICPPRYQDTDFGHISMPSTTKVRDVLDWDYGPKGLVIHGRTRRCKSRVAWHLLKRLMLEGRWVEAVSATRFARDCAEAWGIGGSAPSSWARPIVTCDVWFLDDLGKEKLTERVESDLFAIIEERFAHLRPIILTLNAEADELKKMFHSPDRAEPFIARLREFCKPVAF